MVPEDRVSPRDKVYAESEFRYTSMFIQLYANCQKELNKMVVRHRKVFERKL